MQKQTIRNYSSQKSKLELQLPKITRTTLSPSFLSAIQWVLQTVHYQQHSLSDIEHQHHRLKKQLLSLNQQVSKIANQLQTKITTRKESRKGLDDREVTAKHIAIYQRDIINNTQIIQRYRKEYEQLERMTHTIDTNDNIQQQLTNTITSINKLKQKIKQLKIKNKQLGNAITNSDSLPDQIQQVRKEVQFIQNKKEKLTFNLYQSEAQLKKSIDRINSIIDDYQIAENFFKEYSVTDQSEENYKKLQTNFQHQNHILEVIKKKNQSINQSKQIKYHQLLKQYENTISNENKLNQKIIQLELNLSSFQNTLQQLTHTLKLSDNQNHQQNQQPLQYINDKEAPHHFLTSIQHQQLQVNHIIKQKIQINNQNICPMQKNKTYQKQEKKQNQTNQNNIQTNQNYSKQRLNKALQKFYSEDQQFQQNSTYTQKQNINFQSIKEQIYGPKIQQQNQRDNITTQKEDSQLQNSNNSQFKMKKQYLFDSQEIINKQSLPSVKKFKRKLSTNKNSIVENGKKQLNKDLQTVRQSIQFVIKKTDLLKNKQILEQINNKQ